MAEYVIRTPPGLSELVAEVVLRLARDTGCSPLAVAPVVQKLTGFRFELVALNGR